MAQDRTVPLDELRAAVERGEIDTVLTVFADHWGRLVGKRADAEFFFDTVVAHGTENCDYLLACDIDNNPLPGFRWASYDEGYGDMRGVVDTSTIRFLPWIDRTAVVIVDLVDVVDGDPVEVSSRRVLQRQVERAANSGWVAMIGSEIEFFLFEESYDEANRRGYRALTPSSPYVEDYHILQTTKDEKVIGSIRRGLTGAGMPLEFSKGEAGRGQHEINLTYQPAVQMADINLLFKNAVKEIAAAHGKSATFMAKPFFDDAGSGLHVHSSLWSSGHSVMAGDDPRGMSELFRWYLGGLLATTAEFCLLYAPTINSFRRFLPDSWAPTAIGWDLDNRTLGYRIVGHGPSMRVESRVPGADANTYHAFAGILAAGMYGIAEAIEPPPPYHGNGYTAAELARVPSSFVEAMARWESSEVARTCFGDDFHHHVLNHAQREWEAFNRTVTGWERRRYFERI